MAEPKPHTQGVLLSAARTVGRPGPAPDVLTYIAAVEYVLDYWAGKGWIIRPKQMPTIEYTCLVGHFDRPTVKR